MKNHLSATELIHLSNEVGNAILRSEQAINNLNLTINNFNFEQVWLEVLSIQFSDLNEEYELAAKRISYQLFLSLLIAKHQAYYIDEGFLEECISKDKQQEFDF